MPSTDHTPEEEASFNRVMAAFSGAKSMHETFRRRCEHFHSLYRSHQDLKRDYAQAGVAGRDGVLLDARRSWGAELFVPYCFSTVETIVPRAVSHRPRMLVLPRDESSEQNIENMRLTIDAQQEQIDYELVLQDVLRSGLKVGIGVQKEFWQKSYARRRTVKRRTFPGEMVGPKAYTLGAEESVCTFDDPMAEWIAPEDFIWDPYADSIRKCEWVIHRSWMSVKRVMERLEQRGDKPAVWNTQAAGKLDRATVEGMSAGGEYSAVWANRMKASGHQDFDRRGQQIHEVWEYHDGDRVFTVLDRQILVMVGENPTLGHLPFQVYRPVKVEGEMVGIGAIEPIEHLQLELNTLRSQRRDNATLKLMQSYAYDDSLIDEDDIVFGPGTTIAVNGSPRDAIMALAVGDIPNSSYQEEAALINDIQRSTGVDDTLSGADSAPGGASSTATGVQLVQAAANRRIEMASRRLEVEVIRDATRMFGRLNQRMILEERDRRVQQEVDPADPGTKRWSWFKIGPDELRGEFDYMPEGGSTQPENTPQLRADADSLWSSFQGNPDVDQQGLLRLVLEKKGIKHPDSLITHGPQGIPPGVIEMLKQARPDLSALFDEAVQMAQSQDAAGGQTEQAPDPAAGGGQA